MRNVKKLTFGAVGLMVMGASLCSAPDARAQDPCLPEFPGRTGNRIYCPDSYKEERTYSALIQLDMTVSPASETVLMWGSDYDPFDGSAWVAAPNPDIAYEIRATCDDVTYTSTPVVTMPGAKGNSVSTTSTQVDCFAGSKVVRPRPATPVFVSKDRFAGTVTLEVPVWAPPPAPADLPEKIIYPKQGYAYRLKYIEFNNDKWGEVKYLEISGNPREHKTGEPSAIFNGKDVVVKDLNPSSVYHFLTDVLYDYGDSYGPCRFQSITSYPLEVNMVNLVTGIIVSKPHKKKK